MNQQQWMARGTPARPAVVSVVLIALLALVALCLVETAVGVYILRAESTQDTGDIGILLAMVLTDLGVNLVLAVGLALAALLTLRARPAGRMLAFVFGGLFLLARCGCGGFSGIIGGKYADGDFQSDDFAFAPDVWFVIVAMEAVSIVVIVLALSLLLSRPARDYFRARRVRAAPPVTTASGPGA